MQAHSFAEQRVAVSSVALLAVLVYGIAGARMRGCAGHSAAARYAVAAVALAIAALCSAGAGSPVLWYGVLCLALVSVFAFDLIKQERARRRRVASLALRPVADAAPTVWIFTAAASSFMLAPYVMLDEQRVAALLVGFCTLAAAAIAWRVASAPAQLDGDDVRSERVRDRTMRGVRSGLTAVLAVGSVMVFISFVNAELPTVVPLQRALLFASQAIWITFGAWVALWWMRGAWHVRRLGGTSFPTHS